MSTVLESANPIEVSPLRAQTVANSPEDAVYRILAAVTSPSPQLDAALFRGLDWDALLQQARHHSLLPLLAHRLLESQDVALPAQIRAGLRSGFQANLLRNFGLFEETKRILLAWREAGIEAIPYKGPALAEQLWGSFALRDCSDLDFLVRRCDVERAGEALLAAGYFHVAPVAPGLRPYLLRDASEEQFRHPQSKTLLELQWAPVPRTLAVAFDADAIWHRAGVIEASGEWVNAPSPEDLFAMLAIHGWKHNWSKLIWLADLAALLRKYPLDWQAIYGSAGKQGWRRILLLAVEMVRRVYGIGCELSRYTDPQLRSLAARLEQNLRSARDNRYFDWHRDMLGARDSRGCRFRQMANFVFTPGLAEYASFRLPAWASPAYRAVRVARVAGLLWDKACQ